MREGLEASSAVVGALAVLEVVTALEAKTNSKGVERVRVEGALSGWVSRRLLEKADAKTSKHTMLAVEWKDGTTTLKRLAVEAEPGATVNDVKRSLEAMTRVPVARQSLTAGDAALVDDERVTATKLVLREEKPKPRHDLKAVPGGDALAAFLPPPQAEPEEPVHLRTTGTLCGGSFTTRKRTPFYAARNCPSAKPPPKPAKVIVQSDDELDGDEPLVEEDDRPRSQVPPSPQREEPLVEIVDVTEPKAPVTTEAVRTAGGPPPTKAVWNSKDTRAPASRARSAVTRPPRVPLAETVFLSRARPAPAPGSGCAARRIWQKAPPSGTRGRHAGGCFYASSGLTARGTRRWEERDVTSWAVERFTELLKEEAARVGPDLCLRFRDVVRVKGDAQVVVFQRRTRFLFDFSEVELAWTAEDDGGSPVFHGRCVVLDAASGTSAADLELETAFAPATDAEKAVGEFMRRRGEGLNLRAAVGAVLERFEAEFVRLTGSGVSLAAAFPRSKRLARR